MEICNTLGIKRVKFSSISGVACQYTVEVFTVHHILYICWENFEISFTNLKLKFSVVDQIHGKTAWKYVFCPNLNLAPLFQVSFGNDFTFRYQSGPFFYFMGHEPSMEFIMPKTLHFYRKTLLDQFPNFEKLKIKQQQILQFFWHAQCYIQKISELRQTFSISFSDKHLCSSQAINGLRGSEWLNVLSYYDHIPEAM